MRLRVLFLAIGLLGLIAGIGCSATTLPTTSPSARQGRLRELRQDQSGPQEHTIPVERANTVIALNYQTDIRRGQLHLELVRPDGLVRWTRDLSSTGTTPLKDRVLVTTESGGNWRLRVVADDWSGTYQVDWNLM